MDVTRLKAAGVPLDRLLPETDHPSGNRRGATEKQPGWTMDVEKAVAAAYAIPADKVRQRFWTTFAELVDATSVEQLLPPVVRAMLAHARQIGG